MSLSQQQALRIADRAMQVMATTGWKPDVFENCGWHVALRNGQIHLHYSEGVGTREGTWFAMLSNDASLLGVGECYWTDDFHHPNPNVVVDHQIELARNFIQRCNTTLEGLFSPLPALNFHTGDKVSVMRLAWKEYPVTRQPKQAVIKCDVIGIGPGPGIWVQDTQRLYPPVQAIRKHIVV